MNICWIYEYSVVVVVDGGGRCRRRMYAQKCVSRPVKQCSEDSKKPTIQEWKKRNTLKKNTKQKKITTTLTGNRRSRECLRGNVRENVFVREIEERKQ